MPEDMVLQSIRAMRKELDMIEEYLKKGSTDYMTRDKRNDMTREKLASAVGGLAEGEV